MKIYFGEKEIKIQKEKTDQQLKWQPFENAMKTLE